MVRVSGEGAGASGKRVRVEATVVAEVEPVGEAMAVAEMVLGEGEMAAVQMAREEEATMAGANLGWGVRAGDLEGECNLEGEEGVMAVAE